MLNFNLRKYYLSCWNEDNLNLNVVCFCLYGGNYYDEYNKYFFDYQLFDVDYFCIKIISLGYMVLKDVVICWGLFFFKFFFIGENLFIFCVDKDMKDFDFEFFIGCGISVFGVKFVVFGVNVLF